MSFSLYMKRALAQVAQGPVMDHVFLCGEVIIERKAGPCLAYSTIGLSE